MDALETGLEWLTHERIGNSLNTGICNREYVHGRKQQYPQCERLCFPAECSTIARERLQNKYVLHLIGSLFLVATLTPRCGSAAGKATFAFSNNL